MVTEKGNKSRSQGRETYVAAQQFEPIPPLYGRLCEPCFGEWSCALSHSSTDGLKAVEVDMFTTGHRFSGLPGTRYRYGAR